MPAFTPPTIRFNKVPTAIRTAPGIRQLRAATTATPDRDKRYRARGVEGNTNPMTRIPRETTRTGQSLRPNVPRRRQSPPKATPAMIPAATPLASMSVADHGFLRQSAAKFGKSLVFDLGKLTRFESGYASSL